MTDVLVRNVDPETLRRLKTRAESNARSLQQELHDILRQAVAADPEGALASARRIRKRLARSHPGQTDSVELVREDRER